MNSNRKNRPCSPEANEETGQTMGRDFADKLARRQLYSHVPEDEDGAALTDYLAAHFSRFDRAGWDNAIKTGLVTVNGLPALPGATVKRHDRIGYWPPETPEPDAELYFRVVYEDDSLLVIDKPGNLCVHPTGPFFRHTLWHLVGSQYGEIRFVHRLDRETSGLVIAARTRRGAAAMDNGNTPVRKEYLALVTGDFRGNPFTWFKGNGLLLAAGDRQSHNAMTIGWGMLGNIWGEEVNTITVFVAPSRYTQQFMEKHKYFTVMKFDDNQQEILRYMGTNSGRDGDKAEALGLHTAYTEHGAPYYLEAREVYECEIIYRNQFEKTGFSDVPQKRYQNFPAGIHHAYIGKVLEAKRR